MHTCMSPHNAQVKEMEGNVLIEVPVHVRMMGEMPLVLEESVYFVHIVPWWLFEMSVCCTIRVPLLMYKEGISQEWAVFCLAFQSR